METKAIAAVRCLTCEAISDADDASSPLYECGSCGEMFDNMVKSDSHRCPSCSKFGSRVADLACPVCGESEVEEIEAWEYDGDYYAAKEGVTLEQIVADHERERIEAQARKEAAKIGPPVTGTKEARQLVPGDWIVVRWGGTGIQAEQVRTVEPRTVWGADMVQVKIGTHGISLQYGATEAVDLTNGTDDAG